MNPPRIPDFLGIGAQKAGTTWLHTQLRTHPDIWLPPKKELHYFDRSAVYPSTNFLDATTPWRRALCAGRQSTDQFLFGMRTMLAETARRRTAQAQWWRRWTFGTVDDGWYASLFAQARGDQLAGEITPSYSLLSHPDVAAIHALNPRMKLIFMLRDPVERAWSSIRFNHAKGALRIDIDSEAQVLAALKEDRLVSRTNYERTLDTYLAHFETGHLLLGFFDAIQRDPVGLITGVTDFLGLRPLPAGMIDNASRANASPPRDMSARVRDFLRDAWGPMVERLAARFGGYAEEWRDSLANPPGVRASVPVPPPAPVHRM